MRIYEIELSCGCLISLDGGGALLPCNYGDSSDCKYFEEYLCSPKWVEWELQTFVNNSSISSDEDIEEIETQLKEVYNKRIEEIKK